MQATDAALAVPARSAAVPAASPVFIQGPVFDCVFFIFSPLLALALAGVLSLTPLARESYTLYGRTESFVTLFSGAFTMAHLFIVFFRSHGNREIFRLYPKRFVLAPVLLFGSMMLSSQVLVFVFVLAVWWDVYHSSLQTFGLGRIYDRRAGNGGEAGRALDWWINLLIYTGPILGGAALVDHIMHFRSFQSVQEVLFYATPEYAEGARVLNRVMIPLGAAGVAAYLLGYARLLRAGYRVSWQKAALLGSTAACSIFAWGYNSFGQAFFIMNFFHALQYFALIWIKEKESIGRVFGGARPRVALPLFILVAFGYGVWAKFFGEANHAAMSVLLTVSILHFWYDSFIWSVRKGQIS